MVARLKLRIKLPPEEAALWRERLKIATGYFIVFSIVATLVEGATFPDRRIQLGIAMVGYAMICGGAMIAVHLWPPFARTITRISALALIGAMADYQLSVGSPVEVFLMPLVLYFCASALIVRDIGTQVMVCATGLAAVAVVGGITTNDLLPVAYSISVVLGATSITVPIAGVGDFAQRKQLE
jgi:hypothetical protein